MSTIRLSIAITHHPSRADLLQGVLERLDGEQEVHLIVDDQQEGLWPTCKRAWMAYNPQATHHLMLHDDILPCLDFLPAVRAALQVIPAEAVSFYANRKVIEQAREQGSSWARVRTLYWSQALALPVSMVQDFLLWEQRFIRPSFRFDDSRLAMYLLAHQRYLWCSVPSLVEHLGYNHSLIGISGKVGKNLRVARWFIGAEVSGLSVDWTKGKDTAPLDASGGMHAFQPWLLPLQETSHA